MRTRLTIIHLTDFHYGDKHIFVPPPEPDSVPGVDIGYPSLAETVLADLQSLDRTEEVQGPTRVIFALTGDFAETADPHQFDSARRMILQFVDQVIFGWKIRHQDIFLVPGNHDCDFATANPQAKWVNYFTFYHAHMEDVAKEVGRPMQPIYPPTPSSLSRIIDQSDENLIVAELNSSGFVQKESREQYRGQLDLRSIGKIRDELITILKNKTESTIRIALVHHHPVVLPQLTEAHRGYDAMVGASNLMNILNDWQFTLILHGHKHVPVIFTYDPLSASDSAPLTPILIVAGGSAGSSLQSNYYNIVDLKWHPQANRTRLRIETRKLQTSDHNGRQQLPIDWKWTRAKLTDRVVGRPSEEEKNSEVFASRRERSLESDGPFEEERDHMIQSLRRNYPAISIIPSLSEGELEATVWLERQEGRDGYEAPASVEWSAGDKFDVYKAKSGKFDARFTYYGPMLIQGRLFWEDGKISKCYIFAHRGENSL